MNGADGSLTLTLTKPRTGRATAAELNRPDGPLRNLVVTLDRSFATVSSGPGTVQLTGGLANVQRRRPRQALGCNPGQPW